MLILNLRMACLGSLASLLIAALRGYNSCARVCCKAFRETGPKAPKATPHLIQKANLNFEVVGFKVFDCTRPERSGITPSKTIRIMVAGDLTP